MAPVRAGDAADDPVFEGKAFAAWAKELVEGDAEASKAAQAALRRAGKAAVPTLARLVGGAHFAAASYACDALARLGPDAVDAVPALVAKLGSDGVDWAAAHALAMIGQVAVPALSEGLQLRIRSRARTRRGYSGCSGRARRRRSGLSSRRPPTRTTSRGRRSCGRSGSCGSIR